MAYGPKGQLTIEVVAEFSDPIVQGTVTAAATTVNLDPVSTASATLLEQLDGTYRSRLKLSHPEGGTIDVAVTLLGERIALSVDLERPELVLLTNTNAAVGSAATFCAVTNQRSDARVKLAIDGGIRSDEGAGSSTLTLSAEEASACTCSIADCGFPEGFIPRQSEPFTVTVTEEQLLIEGELRDTPEQTELRVQPNVGVPPVLELEAAPEGSSVRLTANLCRSSTTACGMGDEPIVGASVSFRSLPAGTFLDTTVATDNTGVAVTYVVVDSVGPVFQASWEGVSDTAFLP